MVMFSSSVPSFSFFDLGSRQIKERHECLHRYNVSENTSLSCECSVALNVTVNGSKASFFFLKEKIKD